jgi:hypothetical protein
VITAAGLILIGTFGSFSLGRVVSLKETGLGLAIGVLIDSTIVRIIMVPATMRLAGKANWYMPAWLKKIVPELREGPAPAPTHVPALAAQAFSAPPHPPVVAPSPSAQYAGAQPFTAASGFPAPAGTPVAPGGFANGPQMAAPARRPIQLPTAPMIGRLRPLSGGLGVDAIPLPRGTAFLIGRDKEADIWLFAEQISRQHARIEYDHRLFSFIISDLQSLNGVYVNGARIAGPTLLRDGDRIEIGGSGKVVFAFDTRPDPWVAPGPR